LSNNQRGSAAQPTGGIPMNAPNDNTARKGLRGWWLSPPRPGPQRLINPWEYRHLRVFGFTRIAGGIVATGIGCGVQKPSPSRATCRFAGETEFWHPTRSVTFSTSRTCLKLAQLPPERTVQVGATARSFVCCCLAGAPEQTGQCTLEFFVDIRRATVGVGHFMKQGAQELLGAFQLITLDDDPFRFLIPDAAASLSSWASMRMV